MTHRIVWPLGLVLVLVAAACGGPSVDEHVRRGDDFLAASQVGEAEIEYRAALQADPARGDVRLKLADLYAAQQQTAKAMGEYVRAADLLPNDRRAQRQAGLLLLTAGQFEDAKTRAEKALALDPRDVDAQILLGNALAGLRDFDGALKEYEDALVLSPSDDRAYRNVAAIQLVRGKPAEAEQAFRKAVEVAPDSVEGRLALAGFLWASRRLAEAERAFTDALALDPANAEANRALGTFYVASRRIAEAEPFFKTLAEANTPAARIGLADYYVTAGRDEEARTVLRGVLAAHALHRDATLRLAAIDAARGQLVAAEERVREFLRREPADMGARLLLARVLLQSGRRDESLKTAQSIAADDPSSRAAPAAFELVGSIQASLDRPDDAIAAYLEVLKRDARPVTAFTALARLYRTKGDLDRAAAYARDALKLEARYAPARAELVRVLLAEDDRPAARRELAALQREFPADPAVLILAGTQQLVERRFDAARASFAKAAAAAPSNLDALSGLVGVELATHRAPQALERIQAALRTLPPSGSLYLLAARVYLAVNDAVRAEDLLKKAIDTDPTRLAAYNLLGMVYIRQQRLPEAEQRFREITRRDPSSVPAHTMLGMLYDVQRKSAEAESQYRRVLAIEPEAPVAANNLAWIYVSSRRETTDAVQLARTAERRLPDDPDVADTLGWALCAQGAYREAIPYLERSVSKAPNPINQFHLGIAYAEWGEVSKARTALTASLASKVPFEGIEQARETLASLPK